ARRHASTARVSRISFSTRRADRRFADRNQTNEPFVAFASRSRRRSEAGAGTPPWYPAGARPAGTEPVRGRPFCAGVPPHPEHEPTLVGGGRRRDRTAAKTSCTSATVVWCGAVVAGFPTTLTPAP